MAPTQSPSTGSKQLLHQLLHNDPSTLPSLRAYGMGYGLSTVPSLLRILVAYMLNKKGSKDRTLLSVLGRLFKAALKGMSPRGFAMAFGIAVGGGKWGEGRVEPVVRDVYFRVLTQVTARRERKCVEAGLVSTDEARPEHKARQILRDERNIKALSTFVSSTISSLLSITLLQSSPSYKRPRNNKAITRIDSDNFGPSPYPSLTTSDSRRAISNGTTNAVLPNAIVAQSPTLDITLFILVRAVDTIVRGIYEYTGVTSGRAGKAVAFIANQADTLVFSLSCWRIMWCWFYEKEKLPPSYNQWIQRLARMDPRLLALLQYARKGEYVYGQVPSAAVAKMSAGIAAQLGQPAEFVNPYYIKRLDCSVVHGKLGAGTCEVNALKRWTRAFIDALAIYGPVHLVPQLLFNFRGLASNPLASVLRIVLAAARSSAFLATFVASIYASVCLVRTRIPLLLLPNVNPQIWDSGLCAGLGCFMCGFSVLIENKRRRREMSLYCAPRAIYTLMDVVVPKFFSRGPTGEFLSRWIERWIFAISTGVTISATVHRPDLVSGVVRGVMGKAVGSWGV